MRFDSESKAASNAPTGAAWRALETQAQALLDEGSALERGGEVERAVEVLLQALSLLAGQGHHPLGADLLYRTGTLRARLGQTNKAEELFKQSLETASWCEYPKGQAYAINGLAVVAQRRGDIVLAESQFRRAGRLASEVCEHRLSGMVELNLGVLANIRGDLDSALVHYESAFAAFDQAEDHEGVCWALNNLGMLQADLARHEEADATFKRGLKLAKREGDRVMAGMLELNRVECLIEQGRWRPARQAVKNVLKMAAERDDALQRAEALKFRAIIEREQGKLDQAAATLDEAGQLAERTEDKLLRAEILRERGETLERQGQTAQAKLHLEYAVRQFSDLDAVLDATDTRQRIQSLAGAAA